MSSIVDANFNEHGTDIDIRPLLAEGRKHFSHKDYARAERLCRAVLERDPAHRVALYLSALCELYQDRLPEAATTLSTLVDCHPDHVNGLVLLSKVCLRLGEHRQSTRHARKALETGIEDDGVLALLAEIFGESEDHESAKAAFERAIRINPGSAAHLCNYASILRIEGRIDEAVDVLERCIALDETHCKAHWMLSSLKRQTKKSNHISRLTTLEAGTAIGTGDRLLIGFALAKEYEDLGEYEKAFDRLSQACRLKRSTVRYDVEADIQQFHQLKTLFDPAYVRRMFGSGYEDYAPVFVLGLPRTGSTLIEQILGAHEQVFAAGELPTLGNEVNRLFARNAYGYPDFSPADSTEVDYRALGQRYVDRSIEFINSARHKSNFDPTTAFVDKMPQNFMYIGFILLALPDAKVIVTERDAMDTCLSNFKQLYNDPFYRFSYELDELGKYFIAYCQLMRHWCKLFDRRILTVNYEEFVADPEPEAARIFKYCGLTWNREYLDRSRRDGMVATASATQVRDTINTRSVGRWKRYERQLSSLHTQLVDAGVIGRLRVASLEPK